MKRVGFLATGSEIVNGEIANTNSQQMAATMQGLGITVGEHLTVDDDLANLKAGFEFLYSRHDAVITTGGLGPTKDDRTREIIAGYTGAKLEFDQASWDRIVERIHARGFELTENNRQQTYFPHGSSIITNENGSANACMLEHQGKLIAMLPGPPHECLPIFEAEVLLYLKANGFVTDNRLHRWRLYGTSESMLADKLDHAVAEKYDVEIAYRAVTGIEKPYIDVKVYLDNSLKNQAIIAAIDELVNQYVN